MTPERPGTRDMMSRIPFDRGRWAVALLWAAGLALFAGRAGLALGQPGDDFRQVWVGVDAFLHRRSPYTAYLALSPPALPFVYPPSALLLMAPAGMLSLPTALPLFVGLDAAAVLAAGLLGLRLVGLPWTSPRAALMPAVLALFAPVTQTLYAGNVNGLVLLAEVAALLAAARRRWLLAGALLGLGFAIKPVLLPLLLLPVIERRWAGAALAAALPTALSLAALPLIVEPHLYVGRVVPGLAASRPVAQNVALSGAAAVLGLPAEVATAIRGIVLVIAAVVLWRLWRGRGDETRRLIYLTALILSATFLGSSFAWGHYGVYLLPLLASALSGDRFTGWLGAAVFYCLGGPDVKLWLLAGPRGLALWQLRVTLSLLLVLVGLARPSPGAPGHPHGSG